jgi:hypothetical protein
MNKYVGASFVYGFTRSVGPVNNLKNTSGKEMHPVTKIAVSDCYIPCASSYIHLQRLEACEAPEEDCI